MTNDNQIAAALLKEAIDKRNELLKSISALDIGRAWDASSHIILPKGSSVAITDCADGAAAYAFAILRPDLRVLAMDKDRRNINKASVLYHADNLQFQSAQSAIDIKPPFRAGGFDAAISNYSSHRVYSKDNYNQGAIVKNLASSLAILKNDGFLFAQDYVAPSFEYVLMEIEATNSSSIEFLKWLSEKARPNMGHGCSGFFLEELERKHKTKRLFRLPHKWANEFIMRLQKGALRSGNIEMEYCAFTPDEMRNNINALGMRLLYSSPKWGTPPKKGESLVVLYDEHWNKLSQDPSGFTVLAQKLGNRASLSIMERRPSSDKPQDIEIKGMRNQKTNEVIDIASTGLEEVNEVFPWKIDEETGRISIWLNDATAKGIVNTAPRKGANIDGKTWSGHMIEPISFDMESLSEIVSKDKISHAATQRFVQSHLGMNSQRSAVIEKSVEIYPAPDQVQEKVQTWFVEVSRPSGAIHVNSHSPTQKKFRARGNFHEFDAQSILNAISCGLIPSAKLEIQIMALFAKLNIPAESRTQGTLALHANKITAQKGLREWLDSGEETGDRFLEIKGTAGDLHAMRSIFVEEGTNNGSISGLASQDMDFIVPQDKTINTAVVLYLTKNIRGDIHAMINLDHLPVPQRYKNNSKVVRLPAFNLPEDVRTLEDARAYVADKLDVLPEMIIELGASYYTHYGITPQRVFPFAVADPPAMEQGQQTDFFPMNDILLNWSSLGDQNIMIAVTRYYKLFGTEMRLDLLRKSTLMQREALEVNQGDKDFLPTFGLPEIIDALPKTEYKKSKNALANAWSADKKPKLKAPKEDVEKAPHEAPQPRQ